MILLLLAGLAQAQQTSEALTVSAWSTSAVEVRPDLSGDPRVRAAERLGVRADLRSGWRLGASGGLRGRSQPYQPLAVDLWRAALVHDGHDHHVQAGRIVRSDVRGLLRLDGLSGDVEAAPGVHLSGWAGRRWHPDSPQVRTAWIGGAQLRMDPGGIGFGPHAAFGAEARDEAGSLQPRAWAALGTRGVRGGRIGAIVEVGSKDRARFQVDGDMVAGRHLDLGGALRWEGLPPATVLDDVRSPLEWLAPEGYGAASARLRWRQGAWSAIVSGGPTVRPGRVWMQGGQGRAALSRRLGDRTDVTAAVAGAGIDRSRVLGGIAAVDHTSERWSLRMDGGCWHLVPLDQRAAWITELRGFGQAVIPGSERVLGGAVSVGGQASVGTDRQLAPFVRGGLQASVRLGRGGDR